MPAPEKDESEQEIEPWFLTKEEETKLIEHREELIKMLLEGRDIFLSNEKLPSPRKKPEWLAVVLRMFNSTKPPSSRRAA